MNALIALLMFVAMPAAGSDVDRTAPVTPDQVRATREAATHVVPGASGSGPPGAPTRVGTNLPRRVARGIMIT